MGAEMKLSEEQLEFIEKFGVFLTEQGMTPAAARINSLLLICKEVELSFDEVRDALQLSKSATSNGLNYLMETKRVEYVTRPGDRKRYFRSNIEMWKTAFNENFLSLQTFHHFLLQVKNLRGGEPTEFDKSLAEITSFMEFAIKELEGIYDKWKKTQEN